MILEDLLVVLVTAQALLAYWWLAEYGRSHWRATPMGKVFLGVGLSHAIVWTLLTFDVYLELPALVWIVALSIKVCAMMAYVRMTRRMRLLGRVG